MGKHRLLAGRTLPEHLEWMRRDMGVLPVLAGGQVSNPFDVSPTGITQDGSGNLTVQNFVDVPLLMNEFIATATTINQDFWIGEIYNTPGVQANAGVVRYALQKPGSLYLPAGSRLRPRAPGAEAPRIAIDMPALLLAYAESWSGSLEIPDEARAHNDRIMLDNALQRVANSFALRLQQRGETALTDFITAQSLSISNPTGSDWAAAPNRNVTNSSAALPEMEWATVRLAFRTDLSGIQPDAVLLSPTDELQLIRIYGTDYKAIMALFGLTPYTSTRLTAGTRIYLKRGQVGSLVYEKTLDAPEYTREGFRWTDIFSWEVKPLFVVNGADSIKSVVKT